MAATSSPAVRLGYRVACLLCFPNDDLSIAFADWMVLPQQGNEFSYQRGTNNVVAAQRTVRVASDEVRFPQGPNMLGEVRLRYIDQRVDIQDAPRTIAQSFQDQQTHRMRHGAEQFRPLIPSDY